MANEIHIFIHGIANEAEVNAKLDTIINQGASLMASLQDLQVTVTAEDTTIDSAITLIQGLAAAVAALPPNQAAIDALSADITAKAAALASAVTANTPATPPGPTVPAGQPAPATPAAIKAAR